MYPYLEEFEKTIKFINLVLSVCGSNILEEKWSQGVKGKLLRVIPMVIIASEPIGNITAFYYNWNDFIKLSQTIMLTMTGGQGYLKMFIFQYFYRDIREVIEVARRFHNKFAKEIEIERSTSTDAIYMKHPLLSIRAMCISYFIAVVLKVTYPFFLEERTLPMDYYISYGPPLETPFYQINYGYQLIQGPMIIFLMMGVEAVFILLVSEACLQFDIISFKLATVGDDDEDTETRKLREIYFMHDEFVRFVNTINKTFSITLLVQFLTSFLMISCSMFMLTATVNIDQISFLVAVFLQLSFYCWYGQFLKNKLDSTLFTMYNNKWYNLNIEQRKSLVIMMSCAQVNQSLKAGGFSEICLETYLGILKTTYSYYAIMKDANQE